MDGGFGWTGMHQLTTAHSSETLVDSCCNPKIDEYKSLHRTHQGALDQGMERVEEFYKFP